MSFETRNLGFNIYRVTPDGLQAVNTDLIAGFATRSTFPTGYGEKYEFFDLNGTTNSSYIIQSRSTQGARVSTQAFGPKLTSDWEHDTGFPKSYYQGIAQNQNGGLEASRLSLPKDLQRTVNDAVLPPDLNMQRWVAAQPGAKITVQRDGMYRVSRSELQNAGFNVNTNSANWRLFMEGNEQAILVGVGDQYIDFYGRGVDTSESDTRAYYLIVDTSTPGKRMATRVLRNFGGNVVAQNFRASAVYRMRTQYNSTVRNGNDGENYFGTFFADQPTTIPDPNDPRYVPYNITHIDFSAPTATLHLKLQGLDRSGAHNVNVTLNGNFLGVITGDGGVSYTGDLTFPTNYLNEGENIFTISANGSSNDWSYFDTATIEYARTFASDSDRLPFFSQNVRRANITGLSTASVRVFDTTYDSNTQILDNFQVVPENGTFTVKLPSDRAAVMYAATDAGMLQSPSVVFNSPSTLSSTNNAADMIIISYSSTDFVQAADGWANYRRSQAGGSFNVRVVDVADIFDEFSYGISSANALADFLEYADRNWQSPHPRYVLLLGDGSYDPRNYEGYGNWNLVPTKMVNLIFQESGSDEALVPDIDSDNRADMAIGRISARSSSDINTVLTKTMSFETPALWDQHRGWDCAYGLPIGYDFEAMCIVLTAHAPPGVPVTMLPHGFPPPNQNDPDPNAHTRLMSALNAGPYIVNYAGHGTAGIWDSSSFFSTSDVAALTNAPNWSIYTMLTCLNGYFIRPRPTDDSIAEALLKAPNGGAVASWASSTDTTPDLQLLMGDRFYDMTANGDIPRLGDLVVDAKSFSLPPQTDVGFSWVLLADPALKVKP